MRPTSVRGAHEDSRRQRHSRHQAVVVDDAVRLRRSRAADARRRNRPRRSRLSNVQQVRHHQDRIRLVSRSIAGECAIEIVELAQAERRFIVTPSSLAAGGARRSAATMPRSSGSTASPTLRSCGNSAFSSDRPWSSARQTSPALRSTMPPDHVRPGAVRSRPDRPSPHGDHRRECPTPWRRPRPDSCRRRRRSEIGGHQLRHPVRHQGCLELASAHRRPGSCASVVAVLVPVRAARGSRGGRAVGEACGSSIKLPSRSARAIRANRRAARRSLSPPSAPMNWRRSQSSSS